MSKLKRFGKGLSAVTLGLGIGYAIDNTFYYSSVTRSFRTFWVVGSVALDYKLNFRPEKIDDIENLHARTAHKIYNLCRTNGGLYIKFGQQIATVPVLPVVYVKLFRQLYDDAPSHPYEIVEKIIEKEFGRPVKEIFSSFDEIPIASASIAQVHKAVKLNGEPVAVKIQKPEIRTQIGFDLFCYVTLMWIVEKTFKLPGLHNSAKYVSHSINQEADFINEAKNAENCKSLLSGASQFLQESVHVPFIDWDLTTKVVLTQEWIEGISFVKFEELEKKNYNLTNLMTIVVSLFADQIFRTGFVHCDPHPGNMIVRNNKRTQKPEIVLLDHGLYIQSSEKFRETYCRFWVGLFTLDMDLLNEIGKEWGIPDISVFATVTLAKPWKEDISPHINNKTFLTDAFKMQEKSKDNLIEFLKNMEKMPQELIFVGRNLNIVRANNKALGSPVNRINIMANYASKSIFLINSSSYSAQLKSQINYLKFRTILFVGTVGFYITRLIYFVKIWLGMKDSGMEGLLDEQLKQTLQQNFPGIVIDDSLFES